VARTAQEQEDLALALARDPAKLKGLRDRLAANRATAPLFNTSAFARDVEAAYVQMHARRQRGEAPAAFSVTPIS
jgi:predicted O-linked N-acetylglucosamine transferase (SPINDLY family)